MIFNTAIKNLLTKKLILNGFDERFLFNRKIFRYIDSNKNVFNLCDISDNELHRIINNYYRKIIVCEIPIDMLKKEYKFRKIYNIIIPDYYKK